MQHPVPPDACWRSVAHSACLPAPHPLRAWLTDPHSLTARIRARCGRLTVTVLAQGRGRPHPDEARLLRLRAGELALLREVLLVADGRPVVYARSLLAPRSLRQGWQVFAGIGSRPLGAALFADPRIARGRLAAKRLDVRDRRYHRAAAVAGQAVPGALWARRSRFMRAGHGLLVCEVFLPAVLDLELR